MIQEQQPQPQQPQPTQQPHPTQQQPQMDCVDAINDVHEKIKWKQAREMHAQKTQSQQQLPELRDPHGILHILKSMRSRL